MSDDTPTQRFPNQGDDVQEDLQEEKQKSKGLLIGLLIAGALLLAAIIILVFILGRASGTPGAGETETPRPSSSATPSATPDAVPSPSAGETEEPDEPAPAPPPPAPTVKVDSFGVSPSTVFCGGNNQASQVDLSFNWATSNGTKVAFGVDTNDAAAAPFFSNLPLDGDSGSNFPSGYVPFQYSCGSQTHKYTITVTDDSGHKASKSVTITDVNYNNTHP